MIRLPLLIPLAASMVPPLVILILCVVAGVGTVLLLPSRREATLRNVGGVVLLAAVLVFVAVLVRATAGAPRDGIGPYFWIFSAIALLGAVRVVTHPRPVYSALYFVLTVFASAGLFVILAAEFMAAALVLIYAGAILITYVFVIMLAAETKPESGPLAGLAEYDVICKEPVVASAVGFALMGILLFVIFDKAEGLPGHVETVEVAQQRELVTEVTSPEVGSPVVSGNTQVLGAYLFEHQIVNLELAGLILTLAMVGAIVIARRKVVNPQAIVSAPEVTIGPATPISDDPHSIPVYGTENPRQKAYPEN